MNISPESRGLTPTRIEISGLPFDVLSEHEVVDFVRASWHADDGGSIVTVNVDIARAAHRNSSFARLVAGGSLVVADGMPLVWAARLQGDSMPERVAGSSLIFSLSEAAAVDGRSVFLLGGAPGMPDKAAHALLSRFPSLCIAGTLSPEFGFDATEEGRRSALDSVVTASPDLVFVGLGFPRQEVLIEELRSLLPHSWFLGCGGAIAMAAGTLPRAAPVLQRLGLEWLHRLALEPKRLAGRYLRDDLPFAIALLARAIAARVRRSLSRTSPHGST